MIVNCCQGRKGGAFLKLLGENAFSALPTDWISNNDFKQ